MQQVEALLSRARIRSSARLRERVRSLSRRRGPVLVRSKTAPVAATIIVLLLGVLPSVRGLVEDIVGMPGTVTLAAESGESGAASVAEVRELAELMIPEFIPEGYRVEQHQDEDGIGTWTPSMIASARKVMGWRRADGAFIVVVVMPDEHQAANLRHEIDRAGDHPRAGSVVVSATNRVGLVRPFPIESLGLTAVWMRWEAPTDQVNMIIATHESQDTVERVARSMGW